MEAILPFTTSAAHTLRSLAGPSSVRVDGQRIIVERLVLTDGALAAALAQRDEVRAAIDARYTDWEAIAAEIESLERDPSSAAVD